MNQIRLVQNMKEDGQQSIIHFGQTLDSELTKRLGKSRVQSIAPKPFFSKIPIPLIKKYLSYLDRFLIFNLRLKFLKKDAIYHVVCQSEYLSSLKNKKKIVTCHDLIPFLQEKENFLGGLRKGSKARILLRKAEVGLKEADHIICVSKNTQKDIMRLLKIKKSKTSVIYMGLLHPFKQIKPIEANLRLWKFGLGDLRTEPFILHVGNNFAYKNRIGVIKVFDSIASKEKKLNLVLGGSPLSRKEKEVLNQSNNKSRIKIVENPDDFLLEALYNKSKILLFPSLYEGFGMPILEAMACGCPVIGSNRGSIPEIILDKQFTPDPDDIDSYVQIASKILNNHEFRANLISKNFKLSQKFSTEKMIDGYISLYQKLGLETDENTNL